MVEVAENKTGTVLRIPKGFKHTEVGLIPEDWEVNHIEDYCEPTSSKRIFEDDYVPYGVPFYRGKEISLLLEKKPITDPYYISEEKFSSLKRSFGAPTKNDILITAVGTLGNVSLVSG